MYVLSRKQGETVVVKANGQTIRVKVVSVQGKRVGLGFDAPEDVLIEREETAAVPAQ